MLERYSLQKLHHDEGTLLMLADLVNRADVGVVQRRRRSRFAPKTFQRLRIARQFIRKEFQRNKGDKFGVVGLLPDTHPAAAELFENVISRDRLPDHLVGSW